MPSGCGVTAMADGRQGDSDWPGRMAGHIRPEAHASELRTRRRRSGPHAQGFGPLWSVGWPVPPAHGPPREQLWPLGTARTARRVSRRAAAPAAGREGPAGGRFRHSLSEEVLPAETVR